MESGGGMEDEEQKRNTDCVYFLASPLTCKKGSECDYRHSESSRVNPRDCWYWLNGNCLNPKCSFRHPPLDGLLGTPTTPGQAASSQAAISAEIPAPHVPASNMNKQSVPCYYFQKGNCLKGDKCIFMHGTSAARIAVPQQVVKFSTSLTEPPQMQKYSWNMESKQQNISTHSSPVPSSDKPNIFNHTVNVKSKQVPLTSAKSLTKDVHVPNNVPSVLSFSSTDDIPRFHQDHLPPGNAHMQNKLKDQFQPLDDQLLNGREAGEFLRESSPGFDVLVDNDDDEESGSLHNQDDFGRAPVKGGRNLNSRDDYENHIDYELNTKYEKDRYSRMDDYDRLGQAHDVSGREQLRVSSKRISDRSSFSDRRLLQKETSHDEMDRSDLRHQLLKQRRLNGSRSAVTPDGHTKRYQRDNYTEERIRGHHAHIDRHQNPRESSISTRLKGRIVLPGRSSPDKVDVQTGKRRDVGQPQGRLSPVRPVEFQRRHQENISHKSNEEFAAGARSLIGKPTKRDDVESLDFAGPKSLAELKGAKVVESSQDHSTGSTTPASMMPDNMKMELRESECSLSFDDPKPLNVILKRKREADSGNSASLNSDVQFIPPVEEKEHDSYFSNIAEDKVGSIDDEEEGLIPTEGESIIYDGQSPAEGDIPVTEGGMDVDVMEEQEAVHYDSRGESDYEAVDGGDYRTEDDNAYQEEEDELDDEDDFAKKVGVMFS
ncbi:zinc finger CCCH domain-containing protein 32-like [Typha latifolia]|uniref:zinc finger CCCH domain-containing protein 32-like n=1 Tax=Typha latifolia TaxID=4733 RepID=UPI003C30A733